MHADQHITFVRDIAADQCEMGFRTEVAGIEDQCSELAKFGVLISYLQRLPMNAMLMLQPEADEFGNRDHLQTVLPARTRASCGTRDMVPSSFMISQITPDGLRPARRARSTAASVCPARTRTPPSRARRGNTCPGRARSFGRIVAGSTAARIVLRTVGRGYPRGDPLARVNRLAKNAVPKFDVLLGDIEAKAQFVAAVRC